MNNKEQLSVNKIAKHVMILNKEVGKIQTDIKWLRWILYYMATMMTFIVGKAIFF